MTKNLTLLILLILLTLLFSNQYLHTESKQSKKKKNNSHQVKKTIRKQYQINSSKPIKPGDINIRLGIK